jgi:hypothetical protein
MEKTGQAKLKCDNLYSLLVIYYSYDEDIKEGEINGACRKQGENLHFVENSRLITM